MEVFLDYSTRDTRLVGITGDLDNLGVYVARNGRAAAENLVDLYNQVIRNIFNKFVTANQSVDVSAFSPSGKRC